MKLFWVDEYNAYDISRIIQVRKNEFIENEFDIKQYEERASEYVQNQLENDRGDLTNRFNMFNVPIMSSDCLPMSPQEMEKQRRKHIQNWVIDAVGEPPVAKYSYSYSIRLDDGTEFEVLEDVFHNIEVALGIVVIE